MQNLLIYHLTGFVTHEASEIKQDSESSLDIVLPTSYVNLQPLEELAAGYVSGWLAKKVLPVFKGCLICSQNILHVGEPIQIHEFITLKEYDAENRLQYCNFNFIQSLVHIHNICNFLFPKIINCKNVTHRIKSIITSTYTFPFQHCPHSLALQNTILNSYIKLLFYHYVKKINNIICKKEVNVMNPDAFQKHVLKHSTI